MTTSKGLVKDSEDYKKVYELFRSGELDSMQYNAEALRTKMEWTQKYEKRAFTSSVERMVNQVRMEELAEVRRKHGKGEFFIFCRGKSTTSDVRLLTLLLLLSSDDRQV